MREKVKYTANRIKGFLSKFERSLRGFTSKRKQSIKDFTSGRELNIKDFLSGRKLSAVNFLSGRGVTKRKAYVIGGGAGVLALAIALIIAVSPGAGFGADPAGDMDAGADVIAEVIPDSGEEGTEYVDGTYIDGILYAKNVHAIVVNGEDIIYLATDRDAEDVLNGIVSRHKTAGSEILNLWFKEDVSIEKREFEWPAPVFSVGDAVSYVLTGTTAPRTYVIKGGDNLWDIAIANGVSLSALEEMNPGLNPKRLSIGMEIFLYETKPFITTAFTEQVISEERISYGVIYEDTDSLYRGQTQVKAVGSYGRKEIVSEITKENGVVVATKVLSEELLAEPVAQVALRGTQSIPVFISSGSGDLGHPLGRIQVISAYGSRGGRHHNGVDLKEAVGAPIYAAADGVVVQSNYSGSFGNIVKLSHGDGLETWYAHCDTLLVSVGEIVTRGQQIATVGTTGNARGSHLHFEIRINGTHKNPMNYI